MAADTSGVRRMLDTLATFAPSSDDGETFDASSAPRFPVPALMQLLSDSGVTIQDASAGDSTFTFDRASVERSLRTHSGRAFTTLIHLAWIYAIPYPEYSTLAYADSAGTLMVRVGDWYVLGLDCRSGQPRIRRIRSLAT